MTIESVMAIVGTVLVGTKAVLTGLEKIAGVTPYDNVEEYTSKIRKYVVKVCKVLDKVDAKPSGGKDA